VRLCFSSINVQLDVELIRRVMSTCISTILRELEITTEPALAAILKTPWRDLENVSGRSAYVVDLVSSIKQVAEVVRGRVEGKVYIRNFADKAVGYVHLTLRFARSRVVRDRAGSGIEAGDEDKADV
jgi:hypothetical protein